MREMLASLFGTKSAVYVFLSAIIVGLSYIIKKLNILEKSDEKQTPTRNECINRHSQHGCHCPFYILCFAIYLCHKTIKEEQMGDKGKKDKDKHNKQAEQAKNEAKKKQQPPSKY